MSGARRVALAAIAVSAIGMIVGGVLVRDAAAQSTPIETLKQQRTAVLNAKSVDELSEYLPEQARAALKQMSAQQKHAALAELKKSVEPTPIYRERIEDTRAAVLIEVPSAPGETKIELMKLENGKWVETGEQHIQSLVPVARGSFAVTGAATASADAVEISQTAVNGRPVVAIADEVLAALRSDEDAPRVILAIDRCLSPGSVDLGARNVAGAIVGSSVALPDSTGATRTFDAHPKGTLTVTRVQDGRFDGSFQLTAENDAGDAVTVSGSLVHAQNPCDQ